MSNKDAAVLNCKEQYPCHTLSCHANIIPSVMSQQQTVNVADLDIAQLSEVRKQLEDVGVDKSRFFRHDH